ncbi:hypothetical protein J1N35_035277 [Gossypium stocksii]|uniref:Uncharacterized protein n=1 Tax=Gossypium stocksii TaxID=47602 RepID=A0A9D3UTP5_9ROSI|nr:hypothetical protein J1N35_035277 [Gossypium stocksii]
MLKFMRLFVKAEDNGAELEVNTQIEIVFKSLTKEFVGFKVAYNLGKKVLTLIQLMKELQSYKLTFNGDLGECVYPSSSSTTALKSSLKELGGSFQLMVALGWALSELCNENKAKYLNSRNP